METPRHRRNWIILAVFTFAAIALAVFFISAPKRYTPDEARLIADAIDKQALHERVAVYDIRRAYIPSVEQYPRGKCILLRSRQISVSSMYCYERIDKRWALVSERIETE
jgi:hypothetical protein